MKTITSISKLVAGILAIASGLYTLFSATGNASLGLPDWAGIANIIVFSALGIFLILGSILDFISEYRRSVRQHKFQYQSDEFFKFFSNWYQQPGLLSIICDDLDWIKTEKNSAIYDQLLAKSRSGQLNLLLGHGIYSLIVVELQRNGAKIKPAPDNIVSTYTFSCLSVMDDAAGKIIVRDKRRKPQPNIGEVIFEEVSNTYVTALLDSLLKC